MTTAGWTSEELERIGSADELHIAPVRGDGTLGRSSARSRRSPSAGRAERATTLRLVPRVDEEGA